MLQSQPVIEGYLLLSNFISGNVYQLERSGLMLLVCRGAVEKIERSTVFCSLLLHSCLLERSYPHKRFLMLNKPSSEAMEFSLFFVGFVIGLDKETRGIGFNLHLFCVKAQRTFSYFCGLNKSKPLEANRISYIRNKTHEDMLL